MISVAKLEQPDFSPRQSSNHILMIEPVAFAYNPETGVDNAFQNKPTSEQATISQLARHEMRTLRDIFIKAGVQVTSFLGQPNCADDVFPNNWLSTSLDRKLFLYPMATNSRSLERRADVIEWLRTAYELSLDLSPAEKRGLALEGTGALVQDHINRRAYVARSKRSDDGLLEQWANKSGYETVIFNSNDPASNKPVYHTNVICHIGTGYAAISPEFIERKDRDRVLSKLGEFHDVIELKPKQIQEFCGNALEVVGANDRRFLALSERAYSHLDEPQISRYSSYVDGFLKTPVPTIENFGGGSVRCMMCELF